jgi:hypothetical protein
MFIEAGFEVVGLTDVEPPLGVAKNIDGELLQRQ